MLRTSKTLRIFGIGAFALTLLAAPFLSTAHADSFNRGSKYGHAEKQDNRWNNSNRGHDRGHVQAAVRNDHRNYYVPPHRHYGPHPTVTKIVYVHNYPARPRLTAEERLYKGIIEAVIIATRPHNYR